MWLESTDWQGQIHAIRFSAEWHDFFDSVDTLDIDGDGLPDRLYRFDPASESPGLFVMRT